MVMAHGFREDRDLGPVLTMIRTSVAALASAAVAVAVTAWIARRKRKSQHLGKPLPHKLHKPKFKSSLHKRCGVLSSPLLVGLYKPSEQMLRENDLSVS